MNINDILITDRMRSDLGNIDELANSIRELGLIEPIVLAADVDSLGRHKLVAGERRLTALRRIGQTDLAYARDYIWSYEVDPLRQKAIELEENLRRKELSWQEQVRGKQQLLELMQAIHGKPVEGRPKMGVAPGFGVNKLAAMLGEAQSQVTEDLQVAAAIKAFPSLARAETKGSAMTQLKILGAVASMQSTAKAKPQVGQQTWEFYNVDFRQADTLPENEPFTPFIDNESVDLIWTDLPYGADVNKMSAHKDGVASFDDSPEILDELLGAISTESYRVLRPDRYAIFCFGFIAYTRLVRSLTEAGFTVNPVPVVWAKNSKSGENPTTRYCNSYEPILVAAKGKPVFIRPGQGNVIQIPVEQGKLQAVQKPVELVKRFLLDTCGRGATVVDFCAGTGTTGVAAHQVGMRSILFEKDPSMYALAKARLESL